MNPERSISEIMTSQLVTVSPDTNAREVYEIFKKNDFHHLPVVDKGEILLGIISKEDFFKVSYILSHQTTGSTWTEKQYQSLTAKNFMTNYPMTLDPDDTIGLAADIFLANKFHALPVVEDHRLQGIVTTHDLLRYSFNSKYVEGKNMRDEDEDEEDDDLLVEEGMDGDDNELF